MHWSTHIVDGDVVVVVVLLWYFRGTFGGVVATTRLDSIEGGGPIVYGIERRSIPILQCTGVLILFCVFCLAL